MSKNLTISNSTADSTINQDLKNIFGSGELDQNSVIRKFLTTAQHIGRNHELKENSVSRNFQLTANDDKTLNTYLHNF